MCIFGGERDLLAAPFSTHSPTEKHIDRLVEMSSRAGRPSVPGCRFECEPQFYRNGYIHSRMWYIKEKFIYYEH